MIQTEIKKLGTDEHAVNVQVPQAEYDRVYANHVGKLQANIKMPGFRPGKTPKGVVEKQFGAKAHEDTVSELVQNYYAEAIEKSGLTPAIQPELELPAVQPATGFQFTLKVVTWPEVKLNKLSKLSVTETTVEVTDADVQSVVERLMGSQVRFEAESDRKAETGDELTIDFAGFVDGEAFEGGRGEDVKLVLGGGQFIPDFEAQLEGAKAGEKRSLDVTFPADYQHKPLAGKAASFEVQIKSVGTAVNASDEEELAGMLNFDNAGALREDVRFRLTSEAEQAQFESNRESALNSLLAANDVGVPEMMIKQDMQQTRERMLKSMREQGMEANSDIFDAPEHQDELHKRSERALATSLLLNAVREAHEIVVSDEDVEAELDQQAKQYPDDQHDAFKKWMYSEKEQMAGLRDKLLEKKCVACIMEQAKTKSVRMSLEEWQQKRDAAHA
ncbi:MAG: trigger factor [Zetaproteobacteria bacterium]|nr:MAG: trigger factor [Zetaproteobacteria bacterium]